MNHECKIRFETRKIDECSGKAFDRCFGEEELTLEIYFCDTDGHEEKFDNWEQRQVNFCPFCGYEAKVKIKGKIDLSKKYNRIGVDEGMGKLDILKKHNLVGRVSD